MIPKWSRARHLSDARKNSPPHRRRSPGRSKTISSISAGESRCPSRSTHPERFSAFIVNSAFNDCLQSIPLHSDLRFFPAVRIWPGDIASQGITAHQSRLLRTICQSLKRWLIVQSSFMVLVVAPGGTVPESREERMPFFSLTGDAHIAGAFIMAITAFSSFP
jgi:hypothetical protein